MGRRGFLRAGRALVAATVLSLCGQLAIAQQAADIFETPVLTLDQDRLFSDTLYGKRVLAELEQVSSELAELNREISAQLTAEEQRLTEQRQTMSPEQFRPLADAFDAKVVQLRDEQDARIRDLQRRRELERRVFMQRVIPVLSELVREVGAVAILDERAVILSADQIDVTESAIARIDSLVGDGGDLAPVSDGTGAVPAEEGGAPATEN
ncbi:OmpH family outer membrane protein [Tropicimonas aquimaris]|uniref:OmpH family outer membrane protein n=1 Tax=Tropicimonas aquimaris TaxID=914152 RepID=A0ABW3IKD0_9RHOB